MEGNDVKEQGVCVCVCVLRWIVRHCVLEGGQILHILIVKPFDLKVQVHVVSSLTKFMLLVL